jgi:hypothetical protein
MCRVYTRGLGGLLWSRVWRCATVGLVGKGGVVEREPPASSTVYSGLGGVPVGGGLGVVVTMLCGLL